MQSKVNLQDRTKNALSELGEKIFLDRYAVKDMKRETLAVGDTVVVLVNPKTGQREIGIIENLDFLAKQVSVRMRNGDLEMRAIEHVDKPLELMPEQMFERIARHIASVEKTEEKQKDWEAKLMSQPSERTRVTPSAQESTVRTAGATKDRRLTAKKH